MKKALWIRGPVVGLIALFCSLALVPAIGTNTLSKVTDKNVEVETSSEAAIVEETTYDDDTEYWALLVGCNEFMNRPDLNLPGNDLSAEHLRDMLLLSSHWQPDHIKMLTGRNASSLNILQGLRWLDKMDDEDDICLFYIATHAGPLMLDFPPFDEEDGDELLTTYSTHRFFDEETRTSYVIPWISYLYDDEINLFLNMLDAKGICAIFNTCYAGGFNDSFDFRIVGGIGRFSMSDTSKISASEWMGEFGEELSESGRVVLMSSEEDKLSLGAVFTYYVTEGLLGMGDTNNDAMCSAEEAFEYAAPQTTYYFSKEFSYPQTPQIFDDYSGELILTSIERPPEQPELTGPTTGESHTEYTYTISSDDPDGDKVRYYVDWGDDAEEWTEYKNSGELVNLTHSWGSIGVYNIWFENEDEHGVSLYEPTCLDKKVIIITDQYLVDQRQTNTYRYQCFNDGALSNTVWLAQSFTPTHSLLTKVDLEAIVSTVHSQELGSLHVSIRSNLTGEVLTECSVIPMQIDTHLLPNVPKFKWTTFDFPDIEIIPGETYYIVCQFEKESVGQWTYAGVDYNHDPDYNGDPYPNGKAFISWNEGNTWEEFSEIHDFCFVTYG